jgi:agmatine deiminase
MNDNGACDRNVGERLAASYVNYYLANNAIILPQFGDKTFDIRAKETMSKIFPNKEIIGVYSREILLGGGNIHCITQQLPKL